MRIPGVVSEWDTYLEHTRLGDHLGGLKTRCNTPARAGPNLPQLGVVQVGTA